MSCIENIVIILYCHNICVFCYFIAMICLDLISVEIATGCTFKRKCTNQAQYGLRVRTYWKCKKMQTKSLN